MYIVTRALYISSYLSSCLIVYQILTPSACKLFLHLLLHATLYIDRHSCACRISMYFYSCLIMLLIHAPVNLPSILFTTSRVQAGTSSVRTLPMYFSTCLVEDLCQVAVFWAQAMHADCHSILHIPTLEDCLVRLHITWPNDSLEVVWRVCPNVTGWHQQVYEYASLCVAYCLASLLFRRISGETRKKRFTSSISTTVWY